MESLSVSVTDWTSAELVYTPDAFTVAVMTSEADAPLVRLKVPHWPVPAVYDPLLALEPPKAKPDGMMSETTTLVAVDGPALATVTVKVTVAPTAGVVVFTALASEISISALSVSTSVAELLPGVGSVVPPGGLMVTVLVSEPVAVITTVPLTV